MSFINLKICKIVGSEQKEAEVATANLSGRQKEEEYRSYFDLHYPLNYLDDGEPTSKEPSQVEGILQNLH